MRGMWHAASEAQQSGEAGEHGAVKSENR